MTSFYSPDDVTMMSDGSKVFCTIEFYQNILATVSSGFSKLLSFQLFFNSSVHLNIICAISIHGTGSKFISFIFRMTIAVVSCSSSSVWHGYKDLEQNVLRKWNIFLRRFNTIRGTTLQCDT